MSSEQMMSLFRDALADVQAALNDARNSSWGSYRPEFALLDDNALSLTVAESETTLDGQQPGTYYFDLTTTRGQIVLRHAFLIAWEELFRTLRVNEREMKKTALQLFMLHEFIHVPQNLDSPTHEGVRQHQAILRTVDYHADAFAILLCFDLLSHRAPSSTAWPDLLAEIIKANLLAIAVFEFYSFGGSSRTDGTAPSRYPFDRMLALRLLRHLTWHYQYHRARSMPRDSSFDDFDIKREPVLSIQWLMDDSRAKRGITPDWPATRPEAEFWIADRDRYGLPVVYRHRATKPEEKWHDLFRGIFEVDVHLSYKFFNEFLSRTPEVVQWQQPLVKGHAGNSPATGRPGVVQNAKFIVNAQQSRQIAIGDHAHVDLPPADED